MWRVGEKNRDRDLTAAAVKVVFHSAVQYPWASEASLGVRVPCYRLFIEALSIHNEFEAVLAGSLVTISPPPPNR